MARTCAALALGAAGFLASSAAALSQQDRLAVDIVYVQQQPERAPVLSNLVKWPEDEGLQGARLGIADNNTTGRFLKQDFTLTEVIVASAVFAALATWTLVELV